MQLGKMIYSFYIWISKTTYSWCLAKTKGPLIIEVEFQAVKIWPLIYKSLVWKKIIGQSIMVLLYIPIFSFRKDLNTSN